jgi:hypothetical protein
MTPPTHPSPEYWRNRAEEARAQAEEMRDADAKQALRKIAEIYEQLAVQASARPSPQNRRARSRRISSAERALVPLGEPLIVEATLSREPRAWGSRISSATARHSSAFIR